MAAISLMLVAAVFAIVVVRLFLGFALGLAVLALLGLGVEALVRGAAVPSAAVQTVPAVTDCSIYPLICEAYTREYNALHDSKRPIRD